MINSNLIEKMTRELLKIFVFDDDLFNKYVEIKRTAGLPSCGWGNFSRAEREKFGIFLAELFANIYWMLFSEGYDCDEIENIAHDLACVGFSELEKKIAREKEELFLSRAENSIDLSIRY